MAGGSFSLTEKLAVTGALLALVAMAVDVEDDLELGRVPRDFTNGPPES